MIQKPFINNLLLALLLVSQTAFSADETPQKQAHPDDNKPIQVEADRLVVQGEEGVSVYEGNVVINRGTTQLTGEKITIFHPNKKFQKAIAIGNLSTFKRFMPEDNTWVNGHAKTIIYDTEAKTTLLEGTAFVNQEGINSISAPKIFYNLDTENLSAGSTLKEKKRVRMTFTPEDEAADNKDKP